ncbi:polysaccharide pyruvyl transferase family protein [Natroniella sulfidigena]|uniref:polysaccharide pyruvyl transferase family protein n=1 Tax=Natroniella sulfidigena TaxID=723921 RepID=UPI00200B25FB|nr:polysaccharide pyruvyl transferase family protein [Natroniella sulfidigena]MCK8816306.1 polysaccharide pyruvyl transferase family protein [Natroniella sulfidigena]
MNVEKKKEYKFMIIGSFSGSNFGDSLVLYSMINAVKNEFDAKVSFVVPSSRPNECSKILSSFDTNIKYIDINMKCNLTYRFFGSKVLSEIKNVDAIITTAGIFFDYKLFDPRYNFILSLTPVLMLAQMLGKKVFGLGVGVTAPNGFLGSKVLKKILNEHDYLALRDKYSLNVSKQLSINTVSDQICDIAHSFFKNNKLKQNNKKSNYIGVNLAKTGNKYNNKVGNLIIGNKYINLMSNFLSEISRKTGKKIFFIATTKSDDKIHKKIKEKNENYCVGSLLLKSSDPYKELKKIPPLDLFIGSRMHACIISTNLGIPTINLAYHPKTEAYMKSIDLEEWILYFSEVENSISKATKKILKAINFKDTICNKMENELIDSRNNATNSVKKMKTYLLDDQNNIDKVTK